MILLRKENVSSLPYYLMAVLPSLLVSTSTETESSDCWGRVSRVKEEESSGRLQKVRIATLSSFSLHTADNHPSGCEDELSTKSIERRSENIASCRFHQYLPEGPKVRAADNLLLRKDVGEKVRATRMNRSPYL